MTAQQQMHRIGALSPIHVVGLLIEGFFELRLSQIKLYAKQKMFRFIRNARTLLVCQSIDLVREGAALILECVSRITPSVLWNAEMLPVLGTIFSAIILRVNQI